MNTIYKYPFSIADEQQIKLPQNADIVYVGLDPNGQACLWASVDSEFQNNEIHIFNRIILHY